MADIIYDTKTDSYLRADGTALTYEDCIEEAKKKKDPGVASFWLVEAESHPRAAG